MTILSDRLRAIKNEFVTENPGIFTDALLEALIDVALAIHDRFFLTATAEEQLAALDRLGEVLTRED